MAPRQGCTVLLVTQKSLASWEQWVGHPISPCCEDYRAEKSPYKGLQCSYLLNCPLG